MAIKTLKNVKLKWCKFGTLDDYGKYSCQIELTDDQAAQMNAWGLKTKVADGQAFVRVRRDAERGPVVVKDAALNVVTANIANGATANVMLDVYEYKKFGGGIACRLDKVQVLVWDVYGDDQDFEAVDEGGVDNNESRGDESEADRLF